MLYYQIGFMLNEFAQQQANVNILNTFRVGCAKQEWAVGYVY